MSQIRLDPDLTVKLRQQSRAQGRSLANLANLLLRRLLHMKPTPPRPTAPAHHSRSKSRSIGNGNSNSRRRQNSAQRPAPPKNPAKPATYHHQIKHH